MLFILDANEYIFALGLAKKLTCENLLITILKSLPSHHIRICRTIVEEVRVNLSDEDFREFIRFINLLTRIDEDFEVPFELGSRYESLGLKPADAFIAAYTEWTGAETLVTENRHFLSRQSDLAFGVINAETCLKLMASSPHKK